MKVLIGTSGYSYEDWRGVFYPKDLPKGKMLNYYVDHFKCVEVNSTYYTIPHFSVFQQLDKKTPVDFEFIVKLNKASTHERKNNRESIGKLIDAVKPIIEKDKFYGFLAQFPYSFKNTPDSRAYLSEIKEQVGDFALFIEFRNWTWVRPETFEFLEQNNIYYVDVDEPALRGLIRPQGITTGKIGYIRFHGRNTKEWWSGSNQTRYNYLYSKSELDEWLINLSRILKKAYKTYIFFNNHPQGKAISNAKMLQALFNAHLDGLQK